MGKGQIRGVALTGFPGGSDSKESAGNARDPGLILESGRYPGEGMAPHSTILAWRIHGRLVGYSPWGHKLYVTERLTLSLYVKYVTNKDLLYSMGN